MVRCQQTSTVLTVNHKTTLEVCPVVKVDPPIGKGHTRVLRECERIHFHRKMLDTFKADNVCKCPLKLS